MALDLPERKTTITTTDKKQIKISKTDLIYLDLKKKSLNSCEANHACFGQLGPFVSHTI